MDGKALAFVPKVLPLQGVRVIFRVAGDKNLPALLIHNDVHPGFFRGSQNFQPGHCLDVLPQDGGVPGMGGVKHIVKAPEQNRPLIVRMMGIDPEELLRQLLFLDAVVIVQSRLSPPADMEGGMDVGLAPLHDLG